MLTQAKRNGLNPVTRNPALKDDPVGRVSEAKQRGSEKQTRQVNNTTQRARYDTRSATSSETVLVQNDG
jgi:hypothetical protein